MGFDPFIAEWGSYASRPQYSVIERCLKISQILEYPDLDISEYVGKLAAIRESFRLDLGENRDITHTISALNSHVFGTCGFSGDFEDYYNPRNNLLNDVIDRRVGVAITISIVYAEVARGAGLEMRLVSFPGRVLVRYGETIIDPLSGGSILSHKDIDGLLAAHMGPRAELEDAMLSPASDERVLVRIVRNLKHSYMHSYAHDKALRCARIALSISSDSAEDMRDAGLLEARLQNRSDALEHLNAYLELNPNGDDVDHVLEMIRHIRSSL